MSFLLNCPTCGPRDVTEFRYGGQLGNTALNLPGVQRERWYHRLGCRRWLVAERDVRTNEVQSIGGLEGEAPAPTPGGAP